MKFLIFLVVAIASHAQSLHYSINWPSGLSLGEATLVSDHQNPGKAGDLWVFDLDLDASVPGFAIRDHEHASASPDFCSFELDKSSLRGRRKGEEKITFDQQKNTITRETLNGGGKSDISVPPCAKDALTFLQFARQELAQGRLVPQQPVAFGSMYQVRFEYTGQQTIRTGEHQVDADRILASIKGSSSDLTVEIFFARDAARTPLLAKVPVSLGTFTVELIR
ncbi:MAG: DUF3108 domain-containing protein [Bryobacteraceae bacterium]|jgi:hypothetical protein